MSLKHGILGFLNYGTMTGYELNKIFSESIDFFWHPQTSQIYRELGKLKQENLVTSKTVLQEDKPNKKEYTITEAGQKELQNWLFSKDDSVMSNFKSEFLMKLFFSDSLTIEQSISHLKTFQQDCIEYGQGLRGTGDSIQNYGALVENKMSPIYWGLTANFGENYILMCIRWAEDSIVILEQEKRKGTAE